MSSHQKLVLESPRWGELTTRNGDAAWLSEAIRDLTASPFDLARFRGLWPELCSEGTTYSAAYAAAPYLVDLAANSAPLVSIECLIVLGLFATVEEDAVPADLEPAYRRAKADALTLTLRALASVPTGYELRYLLATVAALRGRRDLADALQNLDTIEEPCPNCGSMVFSTELQKIIETEAAARV